MKFKVGMRVKKVRGEVDIGATGVVVAGSLDPVDVAAGYDFLFQQDQSGLDIYGRRHQAGCVYSCKSWQFEPILDNGDTAEETRKLGADLLASLNLDADLPTPSRPERAVACLFGGPHKGYTVRASLTGSRR